MEIPFNIDPLVFYCLLALIGYGAFHILYNVFIRWGSDIHWWEKYVECSNCRNKSKVDSYASFEVLDQYYQHETKSGEADLRYKENPLLAKVRYTYDCQACSSKTNLIQIEISRWEKMNKADVESAKQAYIEWKESGEELLLATRKLLIKEKRDTSKVDALLVKNHGYILGEPENENFASNKRKVKKKR